MLNLAHTPYTKKKQASSGYGEFIAKVSLARCNVRMDVYEIYWNIKFNHGLESINNNFGMKQRAGKN